LKESPETAIVLAQFELNLFYLFPRRLKNIYRERDRETERERETFLFLLLLLSLGFMGLRLASFGSHCKSKLLD
jgi:hypothetical protein